MEPQQEYRDWPSSVQEALLSWWAYSKREGTPLNHDRFICGHKEPDIVCGEVVGQLSPSKFRCLSAKVSSAVVITSTARVTILIGERIGGRDLTTDLLLS